MKTTSLNNTILLEPYISTRKIEATVNKGLATVKQKGTMIGLKVIADAKLSDSHIVKKGSIAYFDESFLHTNQGLLKPMTCDAIEGQFIIMNIGNVVFLKEE
jgi:hypothetical protein